MKLILIIVLFFSAFVKAQEEVRNILKEIAQSAVEELVASGRSEGFTTLTLTQALKSEEALDILEESVKKEIEARRGSMTSVLVEQNLQKQKIRDVLKEVVDSAVENLTIREKLLNKLEETIKKSFEEFVESRQSKGLTALEVAQEALESEEVLDVLEEGIKRQFKELEPPAGVTALAWQKAQSVLETKEVRDLLKESISKAVEELEELERKKEELINSLKKTLKKSFEEFVASGQSEGLTALEVAQGALENKEVLDVLEKDINRQIKTLKSGPVGLTVLDWAQRLGNKQIINFLENKKAKAPREYDLTALELAQRLEKLNIRDLLIEAIDRAAVEFLDEKHFAWARRQCALEF